MIKKPNKLIKTGKEIIIEIVGWGAIEFFFIGLAFVLYYITKRSSLEMWYILGVPVTLIILALIILIIMGIYKLIILFKKLKT